MGPYRFALLEALCPKLFESAEILTPVFDQYKRFIGCVSTTGKKFRPKVLESAFNDGLVTKDMEITSKGTVAYQNEIMASNGTNQAKRYTGDAMRRVQLDWKGGTRRYPYG